MADWKNRASYAFTAIILIGMIANGAFLLWTQTESGKANRLERMREACAAGRAEPMNCIKEGVPMTWAIVDSGI